MTDPDYSKAGAPQAARFYCPCCEQASFQFLPFGIIPRPHAQCPRCGSLERHRLLWMYLKERTNVLSADVTLLHVAPEAVLSLGLRSRPNITYVSADLEPGKAMLQMDLADIEIEDASFDAIICSHVLEHVPDDKQAMRELARILKPGGWALLQVPIDISRASTFEDKTIVSAEDRERLFGQHDHVRVYGRDYADRLRECGFNVSVEAYATQLGLEQIHRFALLETEDIHCCSKADVASRRGDETRRKRKKLGDMLRERRIAAAAGAVTPKPWRDEWFARVQAVKDDLAALVRAGEEFILVDEAQLSRGGLIEGRRDIPFLECKGEYGGPPSDDEVAIRELERLRSAGASYIVFAWPAFWWLEHYGGFNQFLRASFACLQENDRFIAFDLRHDRRQNTSRGEIAAEASNE